MSPNAPAGPEDFREQLSAWHDGALPDEASRFVLSRLLKDEALRAEVGRWQMMGDALRRQPQQRPAVDLASRVAVAVDAAAARASVPTPHAGPSAVSRGRALRWVATAAAVGFAAVLMWPSAPGPVDYAAVTLVETTPDRVASPLPAVASGRPVPLPLRLPQTAAESLTDAVPPLVRAPQPTPEQLAPLPSVDAPSRPWPRSASAHDAYTVDYGVPPSPPPRQ